MLNIIKTPRVKADLIEIWNYIAETSDNRADSFVDGLDKKLQILAQSPEIGRLRPELMKNLRSFPIGRYIIFYRIFTSNIEIIRILHGARDINTNFF